MLESPEAPPLGEGEGGAGEGEQRARGGGAVVGDPDTERGGCGDGRGDLRRPLRPEVGQLRRLGGEVGDHRAP